MFKFKIFISVTIFSTLLIGTSIIKNQSRDIEKKIYNLSKNIFIKEKDLNESQLEYSYLSSPVMIEKKIEHLDNSKYFPMEYSKIFLSISSFMDFQNKLALQENYNEKKIQKK